MRLLDKEQLLLAKAATYSIEVDDVRCDNCLFHSPKLVGDGLTTCWHCWDIDPMIVQCDSFCRFFAKEE